MYQVFFLPEAVNDISEAAKWYNSKRQGLGKRFTHEIRNSLYYIQKNPNLFAVRYDSIRVVQLNSFPFLIHYSFSESQERIIVSAVLHTSRNPNSWNR